MNVDEEFFGILLIILFLPLVVLVWMFTGFRQFLAGCVFFFIAFYVYGGVKCNWEVPCNYSKSNAATIYQAK